MKTKFIKLSVVIVLSITVSACVIAPVQPSGYRITSTSISTSSTAMPTYVNGQYVGVQTGDYVVQNQTPTYVATPSSTVVYVQNSPPPVYSYRPYSNYAPYYAPTYVSPWYGVGAGIVTGVGIGIGINATRGWGGHRGWHGGHARGGHRGWRR